ASATAGDSPLPDYSGNWYLLEEDGDRYVLEFGREPGGLDGYKVTLEVTCPDAFTLTETVKGGVPLKDYQRFVRATPARSPGARGERTDEQLRARRARPGRRHDDGRLPAVPEAAATAAAGHYPLAHLLLHVRGHILN